MEIRTSRNIWQIVAICVAIIVLGTVGIIVFPQYKGTFITAMFGLVCIIVSLVMEKGMTSKVENCSYLTTGTIVDYYRKDNGDEADSFFPVYEYGYGGNTYRVQSELSDNPSRLPEGREVEVYLNPDQPEESYISDTRRNSMKFLKLIRLIGAGFIVMGFFIK